VKEGIVELKPSPRGGLEEFLSSVPKERKLRQAVDVKRLILREVEEAGLPRL